MKTFLLDTNVLLSDVNAVNSFGDNDVVIPMVVIEELDRCKNRSDEVGRNARHVCRLLDDMRGCDGSLIDGVRLPGGGWLRVECTTSNTMPVDLDASKTDNMIIAHALQKKAHDYVLVSRDVNVRVKCDSLGVMCEDYTKLRVSADPDEFYTGVKVLEVADDLVSGFYDTGVLSLTDDITKDNVFYPNQIVVLKSIGDKRSALAKCGVNCDILKQIPKIESVYGLKPRNKEQHFSLDLLLDPNIKLLTLTGPSGCVSPDTLVTVILSHPNWELPVPVDTYDHVDSEDDEPIQDL